jgi:hypothetical protein
MRRTTLAPWTDGPGAALADDTAPPGRLRCAYLLTKDARSRTMTFLSRNIANIVAIAFGLTAAVAATAVFALAR